MTRRKHKSKNRMLDIQLICAFISLVKTKKNHQQCYRRAYRSYVICSKHIYLHTWHPPQRYWQKAKHADIEFIQNILCMHNVQLPTDNLQKLNIFIFIYIFQKDNDSVWNICISLQVLKALHICGIQLWSDRIITLVFKMVSFFCGILHKWCVSKSCVRETDFLKLIIWNRKTILMPNPLKSWNIQNNIFIQSVCVWSFLITSGI